MAFLTTFGDFADILAIVVATMLRRVARRSTWRHDGNTNMYKPVNSNRKSGSNGE